MPILPGPDAAVALFERDGSEFRQVVHFAPACGDGGNIQLYTGRDRLDRRQDIYLKVMQFDNRNTQCSISARADSVTGERYALSLRQPLVIIVMISIWFIGVFLTFSLFGLKFDRGGFASFVLLSGLVVNAGICLINDYNIFRRNGVRAGLHTYIRAYNRKIVPIMLTVLSTVLGLVPFVVISREPFWFSFAAGAMGGWFPRSW